MYMVLIVWQYLQPQSLKNTRARTTISPVYVRFPALKEFFNSMLLPIMYPILGLDDRSATFNCLLLEGEMAGIVA